MTNLRLYTFCNFYLNSISQGIQTAHVISEMANQYRFRSGNASGMFWNWAQDSKTIIVCNGGMGADIHEAYCAFGNELTHSGYPSEIFYEEVRAFAGTQSPTCWGVVLPEHVYNAKKRIAESGEQYYEYDEGNIVIDSCRNYRKYTSDHPLYKFLEYKNSCGLAR